MKIFEPEQTVMFKGELTELNDSVTKVTLPEIEMRLHNLSGFYGIESDAWDGIALQIWANDPKGNGFDQRLNIDVRIKEGESTMQSTNHDGNWSDTRTWINAQKFALLLGEAYED